MKGVIFVDGMPGQIAALVVVVVVVSRQADESTSLVISLSVDIFSIMFLALWCAMCRFVGSFDLSHSGVHGRDAVFCPVFGFWTKVCSKSSN